LFERPRRSRMPLVVVLLLMILALIAAWASGMLGS
jgi:hypothetical protein